jgi:hypothetical protein
MGGTIDAGVAAAEIAASVGADFCRSLLKLVEYFRAAVSTEVQENISKLQVACDTEPAAVYLEMAPYLTPFAAAVEAADISRVADAARNVARARVSSQHRSLSIIDTIVAAWDDTSPKTQQKAWTQMRYLVDTAKLVADL